MIRRSEPGQLFYNVPAKLVPDGKEIHDLSHAFKMDNDWKRVKLDHIFLMYIKDKVKVQGVQIGW